MSAEFTDRCRALLAELGLIEAGAVLSVQPLSGGVASDIAKVTTFGGAGSETSYCVKFALPKLRVKADWFAPVERNFAEYSWLKTVAAIAPEASIDLYGHSAHHNGFVMSYLEGDDTYLLKSVLLAGGGQAEQAEAIGQLLGKIHAHTSTTSFSRDGFYNQDDFYAIRIEPYLVHTARSYPEHSAAFQRMADQLYEAEAVLIHGDVSPKNILFCVDRPYMLDAECATMGDACFDVAFCLNHFILKALHVPGCLQRYLSFCPAFWAAYSGHVCWEAAEVLERRLLTLLPMMMLARVDGKSPVDYLSAAEQARVRQIALHFLAAPARSLDLFIQTIERHASQ